MLASEQMTQFPDSTTAVLGRTGRKYSDSGYIQYAYTTLTTEIERIFNVLLVNVWGMEVREGEVQADSRAAATSCRMALCISSWRSKLVLINCFSSSI